MQRQVGHEPPRLEGAGGGWREANLEQRRVARLSSFGVEEQRQRGALLQHLNRNAGVMDGYDLSAGLAGHGGVVRDTDGGFSVEQRSSSCTLG